LKNILQNLAFALVAIILTLAVAEVALRMEGRYHDLASQDLVSSPAIWDRPANRVEFGRHPDLKVPVEIRFDQDGVRNHSELSTREKRNIVGFFGDSFVENRGIEDRFSFTSILDAVAQPDARVVNYGVEGYGLDQEYLRYKKYENHDIHNVVYVFCENDLRGLQETGITEITQDGDITFRAPRINHFYRLIGRFHVTYLVITAYYKVRMLVHFISTGNWEWKSLRAFNDWFDLDPAYWITSDFLSPSPSSSTLGLSQKFLVLLEKWKHEVEASQRTFTVLVLPWKLDDAVATKLFRNFDGNVIHSIGIFKNCENCKFQNDPHWNEYGNERVADFVRSDESLPFHNKFNLTKHASVKIGIDEYYNGLLR